MKIGKWADQRLASRVPIGRDGRGGRLRSKVVTAMDRTELEKKIAEIRDRGGCECFVPPAIGRRLWLPGPAGGG